MDSIESSGGIATIFFGGLEALFALFLVACARGRPVWINSKRPYSKTRLRICKSQHNQYIEGFRKNIPQPHCTKPIHFKSVETVLPHWLWRCDLSKYVQILNARHPCDSDEGPAAVQPKCSSSIPKMWIFQISTVLSETPAFRIMFDHFQLTVLISQFEAKSRSYKLQYKSPACLRGADCASLAETYEGS